MRVSLRRHSTQCSTKQQQHVFAKLLLLHIMDSFVSRKRRRLSPSAPLSQQLAPPNDHPKFPSPTPVEEEDSTEVKLATLASLHPFVEQSFLLDILLANQGSVEDASRALSNPDSCSSPSKPKPAAHASNSYQSSLLNFSKATPDAATKALTKRGRTLHLYSPEDVEAHTPCSIIHNFLPAEEANDLLKELLEEVPTFKSASFKLFDNYVQSPHTACFYVQSVDEERRQKTEYLYNGAYLTVCDLRCHVSLLRRGKNIGTQIDVAAGRVLRYFGCVK